MHIIAHIYLHKYIYKSYFGIYQHVRMRLLHAVLVWLLLYCLSVWYFSFRTDWVVIYGHKYAKNLAVVHKQSILPEFILIDDILILPNTDVVFCCKRLHTIRFHKHLYCYEVMFLNEFVTTSYDGLLDHLPLDVYNISVNTTLRKFIRMKYDLSDAE